MRFKLSVDITSRCNLACRHCYIVSDPAYNQKPEMSFEEISGLLARCAEAGVGELTLSGGEPLFRSGFGKWYCEMLPTLRMRGVKVNIFTNGYLLERSFSILRCQPPDNLTLSLYGLSPEVFESVTQKKCAPEYASLIGQVVSLGIPMQLHFLVTRRSIADFEAVESLAKSLGVPLSYHYKIYPTYSGSRTPFEESVDALTAGRLARRPDQLAFYLKRLIEYKDTSVYGCDGGFGSFSLTTDGNLGPCKASVSSVNIRNYSASEIRNAICEIQNSAVVMKQRPDVCMECAARAVCDICPVEMKARTGRNLPEKEECDHVRDRMIAVKRYMRAASCA